MNRTGMWLAAACVAGLAQAAEAEVSVGGRLWYVHFADGAVDSTYMVGPKAEYSSGDFWISGAFLLGQTTTIDEDIDLHDAEFVAGLNLAMFDVGVGLRHTTWPFQTNGAQTNVSVFGPMAYIGASSSFGRSPLGWYARASFMFRDLGDMKDQSPSGDSGEHCDVEAGLSLSADRLQCAFGYRIRKFIKHDSEGRDPGQSGLAVTGVFSF